MIFLLLFLDILVGCFGKYFTYFVIVYVYNKPFKYYLLVGLLLDFILFNTYYVYVVIFSLIYLVSKLFDRFNKDKFIVYMVNILVNLLFFVVVSSVLFKNDFYRIFYIIKNGLVINIIFYIIYYFCFVNKSNIFIKNTK